MKDLSFTENIGEGLSKNRKKKINLLMEQIISETSLEIPDAKQIPR